MTFCPNRLAKKTNKMHGVWTKAFQKYLNLSEKLEYVNNKIFELDSVTERESLDILVDVNVINKDKIGLDVQYLVYQCGWSPVYDLRIKNKKVNVRYGPSFDYPIKYIYKKVQLPIKIIDKKENFRRILDHKNNSGWIHVSQLRKSKSLIALKKKILFKKPTKFSKPLAKIEKGRLLLVKKCEDNWCKIQTGEFIGWINKENIWGSVN